MEPIADLPAAVAAAVDGATWSSVRGGLSDARVDLLRFPDGHHAFLKSAPSTHDPELPGAQLVAEHERLQWLADLLPVPEVVAFADGPAGSFLLTAAAAGSPATDPVNHQDPDALIVALAAGLRRVHDLPTAGCPGPVGVDPRLERARSRVERGLVHQRDFEPAYARFTPERLVELLVDARPSGPEDLVVVHGDPSLTNLLLGPVGDERTLAITGYVDVDRAGVADRYLDLAIIARSLASNLTPEALGPFFHAYGIEAPDLAKVDFYVLLDEFW